MVARLEEIVGGEIVEKAVIVGTLAILEAFELNLSRLHFFSGVDMLVGVADIAKIDRVKNE